MLNEVLKMLRGGGQAARLLGELRGPAAAAGGQGAAVAPRAAAGGGAEPCSRRGHSRAKGAEEIQREAGGQAPIRNMI